MEEEDKLIKIKENLYSRQIGTYGEEAMKKIIKLKVLILGLKGLGNEIAKNIILTGPKKVLIYDPDIAKIEHLGSNYFISEKDINKKRIDKSCLDSLSKLNPYTIVEILNINNQSNLYEELDNNDLDIIIQTEVRSKKEIIKLNEFCRKKNIKFIYGNTLGLFGFIFVDFGKEHIIYDQTGEHKKYLCKNITNSKKAIITVVNEMDNIFDLDTDDYIIFKNVKGMIELNDNQPRKIEVIGDNIFTIEEDSTKYGKFEGNGDIYEYKNPLKKEYLSFEENINIPFNRLSSEQNFFDQPENKPRQNLLYLSVILSIGEYLDNNKNIINDLKNDETIKIILNEAKFKFNKMIEHENLVGIDYEGYEDNEIQKFDKNIVYNIIKFSQYNIIPICSLLGGYISQEIIKVTGKYVPIDQWMFFDLYDPNFKYGLNYDIQKLKNRYYDQISIYGEKIQEKLRNLKIFVSGAGAVGCEILKNVALMGVSTYKDGLLTITDYDNIENSNLNRQFLFNNENINEKKSTTACNAIKKFNKDFQCKDLHQKVCKETEAFFNEKFWTKQDIIISAVDNDDARVYLNNKCFKYNKLFLNAGTSGVRAKADIIIPKITYPLKINYNETKKNINMCTIRKFPSKIDHCIEWSHDLYQFLFRDNIRLFNNFIFNKEEFIKSLSKEPDDAILSKYKIIKNIIDILEKENIEKKNHKILELSIKYFYIIYIKSIEDLLLNYPPDKIDNGILFWSGSRKKPFPFSSININDKMTKQFLFSFCFIFAHCLKIPFEKNIFVDNNKLNLIIEKIYNSIKNDRKEIKKNKNQIIEDMNRIIERINKNKDINFEINEEIYNKDGLTNNHIEFIQSSSNLRARNYSIDEESKNKILMISGQIIPSVPTSTAAIAGYLSLQIINLMYTHDTENIIKNAFFHLGLNIFDLIPQEKMEEESESEEKKYADYQGIEIKGSKTCKEFLDYMLNIYNLEIFHIEINDKIIYDKRVTKDPHKLKKISERNQKKLEDLYFEQTKKTNIEKDFKKELLIIKINCRMEKEGNIKEEIYDFPLIKYKIE